MVKDDDDTYAYTEAMLNNSQLEYEVISLEADTIRDAPVPVPDWVTGSPLLQNT